jgi:5-enolpyruvylshikimate-3-phosphate synthase
MALYHNLDFCLQNMNYCDDVMEMLKIYDKLGKKYKIDEDKLYVYHDSESKIADKQLQILNSGTCLRFVLPYLAFCHQENTTIKLGNRLAHRPILPLIDCLNAAGADVTKNGDMINITPAKFVSESMSVNSSESSQFLSSLMMFATSQENKFHLTVNGKIASLAYIKMTQDVIKVSRHLSRPSLVSYHTPSLTPLL